MVESNTDGYGRLGLSFHRTCGSGSKITHHHGAYKIFLNHWKFVLLGTKGCHRDKHNFIVEVSVNTEGSATAAKLKAVWIPDALSKHKHFVTKRRTECTGIAPKNMKCFNLSAFDSIQDRSFVLSLEISSAKRQRKTKVEFYCIPSCWYSWSNASDVCEEMSGTLPVFASSKQLEAFLAFLSFEKWAPQREAVFIGLKSTPSDKVCLDLILPYCIFQQLCKKFLLNFAAFPRVWQHSMFPQPKQKMDTKRNKKKTAT